MPLEGGRKRPSNMDSTIWALDSCVIWIQFVNLFFRSWITVSKFQWVRHFSFWLVRSMDTGYKIFGKFIRQKLKRIIFLFVISGKLVHKQRWDNQDGFIGRQLMGTEGSNFPKTSNQCLVESRIDRVNLESIQGPPKNNCLYPPMLKQLKDKFHINQSQIKNAISLF